MMTKKEAKFWFDAGKRYAEVNMMPIFDEEDLNILDAGRFEELWNEKKGE